MTASTPSVDPALNRAAIMLDRALTELRHGRAIVVQASHPVAWVFSAVETLTQPSWQCWQGMGRPVHLFVSAQRAHALGLTVPVAGDNPAAGGLDAPGHELPFSRMLPAGTPLETLWQWAGLDVAQAGTPSGIAPSVITPESDSLLRELAGAALVAARFGRLAPAVVGMPVPGQGGVHVQGSAPAPRNGHGPDDVHAPGNGPGTGDVHMQGGGREPAGAQGFLPDEVLSVAAGLLLGHAQARPVRLERVSEAPVPLADAARARFVVFRESHSDFEHVAVIVGEPPLDGSTPVRVRLHSSCLTGDLFGSLRCDCGDQLRGTVKRLAEGGGGIVLYLSQEGRGIGLINKLRAYRRQDQGLDTLDANQSLGFRVDERHFEVAAGMLQQLGVRRIHLLTNNPAKIAALSGAGIEVVEREQVMGGVNPHNQRYLATKLKRGGHLFDEDSLQNP